MRKLGFRSRPILGVAFSLLLVSAVAAQENPDPGRFENAIAAFQEADRVNPPPAHPIVFVGSSSIRLWPLGERFLAMRVLNRGFGGSHISDVLHFLDETVLRYSPGVVVFYAGDNDIGSGKSAQQVFNDYREFCTRVHAALSETKIVWLPIKPSLARWSLWPQMEEVNRMVAEYSETDPLLSWVDTPTPMLDADGKPRPELFVDDGLHMTPAGYDIWTRFVMEHFAAIGVEP